MRCPQCDHEVDDAGAAFCPRCGAALSSAEGGATERLGHADGGGTVEYGAGSNRTGRGGGLRDAAPVRDLVASTRRALARGGWLDASSAAALAFLATLLVGSVLLVAAKLQHPPLGADAHPLSVFTAIVITSLAAYGAPVTIGGLELSAVPLGALAAVGLAIAWSASLLVRRRDAPDARRRAVEGARIAVPLGAICFVVAVVFQIREDPDPVSVSAIHALLLGVLWGAVFGALGGLRTGAPLLSLAARALARLHAHSREVHNGLLAAATMLVSALVLGAGAALVWVIVALARGTVPETFSAGDAIASVVYLLAFLPNVVVAIVALSLGAPVEVGARVTFEAEVVGPLRSFSLWDWGGDPAPWYLFVLVLVPAVSCVLGGFAASRRSSDGGGPAEPLALAALGFAAIVALLAWTGAARLAAGVVHERGSAQIAARPGITLILAGVWAAAGGYVGWRLARGQDG